MSGGAQPRTARRQGEAHGPHEPATGQGGLHDSRADRAHLAHDDTDAPARGPRDTDIAIVGMAVRFPGADDLDAFRANLRAGHDGVRTMPAARAAATGLDPAADYLPMGYLDDIHTFDHAFFGLTRHEAGLIDPQHRLALTLAHQAIEDAGQSTQELRGRSTAVVFSAASSGYGKRLDLSDVVGSLGNAPFGLPSRIAHTLGLDGPCYSLDSGCNGSLLAVRLACRELAAGDAEYALAGGVSLRPDGVTREQVGGFAEIASSTDRCRSFDATADGTVAGEGGAALLLTTLARARAARLPVHAVIRGIAARHNGGAAATISAPSASAHATVIRQAWRTAGADLARAGYLEAHGSGTRLGDAVELEGLTEVFRGRARPLPVGAVKSNIGHLDGAAGVASLVKAVLSVRDGELYPSLHFTEPPPGVDLRAASLEMIGETRPWEDDERIAGVSSFSLGGGNAHCVVQAPPRTPAPGTAEPRTPRLVGVSARTRADLARLCADLAVALHGDTRHLDDIADTLNRGRTHYQHRVGLTADSTGALALNLAAQATWLAAGPEEHTSIAPSRGDRPQVVLLLSPDAPAPFPLPTEPPELPDRLPADGAAAEILSSQLAAVDELRRCGVRPDVVIGAGVSRYLARYLRAELTPADTADLAAGTVPGPLDATRFAEVAADLLDQGPAVFIDVSPGGSLGSLTRARFGADPRARCHIVDADDRGLLGVLGALYEAGVDPDWSAVGPAAPRHSRARLPGHPLRPTPCWLPPRDASAAPPAPAPTPKTEDGTGRAAEPDGGPDTLDWLCATLGELLGIPVPDPESDFFELRGNSLVALQVINRVEERSGVRHRLLDLYEHPRIEDFARFIGEFPDSPARREAAPAPAGTPGSHAAPTTTEPAPSPRPAAPTERPELVVRDEMTMSFGQERMWFHHQIEPGTTLYNQPTVRRVDGPLDVDALRGMWHDLALRHEPLRCNFVDVDGAPQLRVRPDPGDFFTFADVSDAPDPESSARELVARAARHRFDVAREPLLRVLLVRLAPERHVMQYTTHHAVSDGGTPRVLRRELPELYAARREGRKARLPALPVRYRDYALWQRELLAGAALDHELAYWKKTLRDAPRVELPLDRPRPARKSYTGDMVPFTVEAPVVRGLRALAAEESVTLFVVLLAGFNLLLARLTGQRDLVVGTPTSGRNHPALQDLIGYFNSTVALRCAVPPQAGLGDFLRRTRATVLDAMDHQEVPFDRVVSALGAQREAGRDPVVDVSFVHQEVPVFTLADGSRGGLFDERENVVTLVEGMPADTSKLDLTLVTSVREGRADVTAGLEYSTELFTAETAAGFISAYQDVLRALAFTHDPAQPIAALLDTPDSAAREAFDAAARSTSDVLRQDPSGTPRRDADSHLEGPR
ncbi:condensation domain-containing protein [Streptomyces flavofungini]|uniref:condensation domain-containing protein n=1 Tax=Streptomyces flavofungini TaxID=68200 RepID=UPI0025B280C1|nr:condensation domain-containing protein [Streptomyces flavofungini]WJV50742.1 condensation domain-containing protein [Streptomyces flavofungini]